MIGGIVPSIYIRELGNFPYVPVFLNRAEASPLIGREVGGASPLVLTHIFDRSNQPIEVRGLALSACPKWDDYTRVRNSLILRRCAMEPHIHWRWFFSIRCTAVYRGSDSSPWCTRFENFINRNRERLKLVVCTGKIK